MKNSFALITISILFFASCKKDSSTITPNPPAPSEKIMSDLSVQFDNRVGDYALYLNIRSYVSEIYAETYTISALKYFISNISLTAVNDSVYTVPQDSSYFLVDQSDNKTWFPSVKVPVGDYKALSFIIGVDSLRNTMDISKRMGVLDPTSSANGMYWGWNSGYIFFKMEGTSPSSTEAGNVFMFHIGGFGGYSAPTINNLKTVNVDLTQNGIAQIRTGRKSNIHLHVDIAKVVDYRGSPVSIARNPIVMFTDYSTNIAYNYSTMFYHEHTEN